MDQLKESLRTLVSEQQELAHKAALSTLSLGRLHQRLIVMERYLLASNRKGVAPPTAPTESQEAAEEKEVEKEEKEEGGTVKPEDPEQQEKKKDVVKEPRHSKANRCST